jgi:hypothetical protein
MHNNESPDTEIQEAANPVVPKHADKAFNPTNGELFRALLVLQIRLLLDGLRDVMLSPVSVVAVLLDLLSPRSRRGQYFQMLCFWGHKSDQWINLFGLPGIDGHGENKPPVGIPGVDTLVEGIEKAVRDGTLRKENRTALRKRVQEVVNEHLK